MIKPINGYDNKYLISDNGNIYSIRRQGHKGGMLNPYNGGNGYLKVSLRNGKEKKYVYIHRLVAEAFIDNPENKPCVNHIDGDKTNNRVENLEWCTYSENMIHAIKEGLNHVPGLSGEQHPNCKLSNEQVKDIRELYSNGVIGSDLAKTYGVTKEQIYNIVHYRERKTL